MSLFTCFIITNSTETGCSDSAVFKDLRVIKIHFDVLHLHQMPSYTINLQNEGKKQMKEEKKKIFQFFGFENWTKPENLIHIQQS